MYQHTIIIGHLGKDPEMRYTPGGAAVTSFSVATSRKWNDAQGQQQEKTTWWKVSAWNKLAEVCNQYLHKGSLVMVEGDVSASAWIGQDGSARATLELTARNVKFLSTRQAEEAAPVADGDVPF